MSSQVKSLYVNGLDWLKFGPNIRTQECERERKKKGSVLILKKNAFLQWKDFMIEKNYSYFRFNPFLCGTFSLQKSRGKIEGVEKLDTFTRKLEGESHFSRGVIQKFHLCYH